MGIEISHYTLGTAWRVSRSAVSTLLDRDIEWDNGKIEIALFWVKDIALYLWDDLHLIPRCGWNSDDPDDGQWIYWLYWSFHFWPEGRWEPIMTAVREKDIER